MNSDLTPRLRSNGNGVEGPRRHEANLRMYQPMGTDPWLPTHGFTEVYWVLYGFYKGYNLQECSIHG